MNPFYVMQQFQSFQNNPMQFMAQSNMNLPQEYMNDPQGAIQHLMDSGQITQAQIDQAKMFARRMGLRI